MSQIENIIQALDTHLADNPDKEYLTPPEANQYLDEVGVLKNRPQRSGQYLRKILRENRDSFPHVQQLKNGHWRIYPSSEIKITWVEEIVSAFKSLGGEIEYSELYRHLEENTHRNLSVTWKATVRARIEERSSDSEAFLEEENLFYTIGEIGNGRWGLRDWEGDWVQLEDEEEDLTKSYKEGSTKKISVNVYERNSKARNKCLKHHGYSCKICGFNFLDRYGDIGKDYIHAHHIIPLSEIYAEYEVDPIKDLIPVCPNCHAIIHRKKPALAIEDVRALLR